MKRESHKVDSTRLQTLSLSFSNIEYQYYEKFGWGETCEHDRVLGNSSTEVSFKKRLPFSKEDISTINKFSNKPDDIDSDSMVVNGFDKSMFSDIQLKLVEYERDSVSVIKFNHGSYEIDVSELKQTLKVYDSETGLVLIEVYQMDGY